MKRREFVKNLGLGALVFTSSGMLLSGCNDSIETDHVEKMSKTEINSIITNSKGQFFNDDYFKNSGTVILYKTYELKKADSDIRFDNVDYMLNVQMIGILKSNFDIFNETFVLSDLTDDDGIIRINDNKAEKEITLFKCDKVISFPLKQKEKHSNLIFDNNYKLPCMSTKKNILSVINNDELKLLIEKL